MRIAQQQTDDLEVLQVIQVARRVEPSSRNAGETLRASAEAKFGVDVALSRAAGFRSVADAWNRSDAFVEERSE